MFQSILIPLDGSELSESVLPYAVQLAKAFRSRVRIAHAVDLMGLHLPEEYDMPDGGVLDDLIAGGREYVDEVAQRLRGEGLDAAGESVIGPAAAAVKKLARKAQADLVAMATHGRSGVGRWVLGSVADTVLHQTQVPLLLFHPGHEHALASLSRAVVPLDGSPLAEKALPCAEAIARALTIPITLVRAVPVTAWPLAPYGAARPPQRLEEERLEEASRHLDGIAAAMRGRGLHGTTFVDRGDPAKVILECSAESAGTLIVMTTHGRSGPKRLVLGSVAGRVIRQGGRPVLVIPAWVKTS